MSADNRDEITRLRDIASEALGVGSWDGAESACVAVLRDVHALIYALSESPAEEAEGALFRLANRAKAAADLWHWQGEQDRSEGRHRHPLIVAAAVRVRKTMDGDATEHAAALRELAEAVDAMGGGK